MDQNGSSERSIKTKMCLNPELFPSPYSLVQRGREKPQNQNAFILNYEQETIMRVKEIPY